MCIYCGTSKYRKIYENHYGNIPLDDNGRTYDIHHVDGNRKNNNPENLIALSIVEHYNIHYSQGDYGAAWLIARKMNLSKEDQSEISRLNALSQIKNGKNKFAGEAGSLLSKEVQSRRIKNGTHILLNGNIQKECHKRALEDGSHHSQVRWTCEICGLHGKSKSNEKRHLKLCSNSMYRANEVLCWQNIKIDEIIFLSGHEFIKKFNAYGGSVYRLIRGVSKCKTVAGWKLLTPQ